MIITEGFRGRGLQGKLISLGMGCKHHVGQYSR
jgi:hypothetical protein